MKFSKLIKSDLGILTLVFLGFSLIFYGYYWFFGYQKLQLLYQNLDGPNYVVIAKSFYDVNFISQVNTTGNPPSYYANHFPLYPILIRLFSFIGYYRSMIFVSFVSAWMFLITLYFLVKRLNLGPKPLLVVLPLTIFPARWFIVSHIGSSESVFLLFISLFLLFFYKQKYFISALFAALAQLTRPHGILIFAGISAYFVFQWLFIKKESFAKLFPKFLPFILIPLALISVFSLYLYRYNDFFAFFHSIAEYRHLQLPPLQIFNSAEDIGTNVRKEIYIFNFMLYFAPFLFMLKKKLYLPFFVHLFFFLPLPFLVHNDLSRYALSSLPFLAIGLAPLISHPYFLISLFSVSPAIMVYAINYTLYNLSL